MNKLYTYMPTIRVLFFTLSLLPLLFSCSFNTQKTYTIADIAVYDNVKKNEVLANDLITYDYGTMIKEELKITDPEVLKDINWQYVITEGQNKIIFRLVLKNKALEHKEQLVSFFENFVILRLEEYSARKPYLDKAVAKANEIIALLNNKQYDSIWSQTTSSFKEHTTKKAQDEAFDKRNKDLVVSIKKQLYRHVYSHLGNDLVGEFYVFHYIYENGNSEKVSLERVDEDLYKLLGYHFTVASH